MHSVMFTFDEHASEENQNRISNQLLDLPGVYNVGRISPDATKPALRRMWYAEVADETAASDLVTQLRQHDGIKSADLPAPRGLV
jgi:hypothetical protein